MPPKLATELPLYNNYEKDRSAETARKRKGDGARKRERQIESKTLK